MGQINIKYNKIDKILYIHFSGDVTVEELLQYIEKVGKDKSLPRVLKVLEDRRDGSFNFSIRENIKISKYAYQFVNDYKKVYMAAVNDKPKETAFTIDYQVLLSKLSSKETIKAFTTVEAAKNWLSRMPNS